MIRKTLTILSLIGLLLSVGLWGVSCHGATYRKHTPSERFNFFAVNGRVALIWFDPIFDDKIGSNPDRLH